MNQIVKAEFLARLRIISNLIFENLNEGTILEIGAGDGELSIFLATKKKYQIIASDIAKKVSLNLKERAKKIENLRTYCCFGLQSFQSVELDFCVITSLKEEKILRILKLDSWRIKNYIFQSIENLKKVREWIKEKGYFIFEEKINEEKDFFYHTIFISKKKGNKIEDEKDVLFGPILLREKTHIFKEYWKKNLSLKEDVLRKIKNKKEVDKIKKECELIKKVLKK